MKYYMTSSFLFCSQMHVIMSMWTSNLHCLEKRDKILFLMDSRCMHNSYSSFYCTCFFFLLSSIHSNKKEHGYMLLLCPNLLFSAPIAPQGQKTRSYLEQGPFFPQKSFVARYQLSLTVFSSKIKNASIFHMLIKYFISKSEKSMDYSACSLSVRIIKVYYHSLTCSAFSSMTQVQGN